MLADTDAVDEHAWIAARVETVGQAAAREAPLLNPLPGNAFRAAAALSCRVDAKARICVRQSYYSVPARLAGRRVQVALGADWLDVRHDGVLVARHTRSLHKGSEDLVLDHYLEVLVHRPGALAGATALVSARATDVFTDRHQLFWDTARRKAGDRDGTKALIGVLLLHRTLPTEAVLAGIDATVAAGRCDPDLVAVEARRHLDSGRPAAVVPDVPAAAGVDDRPVPTAGRGTTTCCRPGHDRAPRPGGRRHRPWRRVSLRPRPISCHGTWPPRAALPEPIRGQRARSSWGRPATGSGAWCLRLSWSCGSGPHPLAVITTPGPPRDTTDSRGQIKPSSWGHIKLTEPLGSGRPGPGPLGITGTDRC